MKHLGHEHTGDTPIAIDGDARPPRRLPYSPSPFVWPTGDDLVHRQKLDDRILGFIHDHAPAGIDMVLRSAMETNYLSSQNTGLSANYAAYCDLQAKQDGHEVPEEVKNLLEKAKNGNATPAELLKLLQSTDVVSLELAKLTHPYHLRSQYLLPMFKAVTDGVEAAGGDVFNIERVPSERVKLHEQNYSPSCFIVTTKGIVSQIGDVVVMKRCAFGVQADPELGFDEEIARKMNDFPHKDIDSAAWRHNVFEETGATDYITKLLAEQEARDFIVAISTGFYGYRIDRKKDTKASREYQRTQELAHLALNALPVGRPKST